MKAGTPMAALSIIIFGASGDLTSRKLVPSLFRLACKDRLPPEARIIGVARTAMSDDQFRAHLAKSVSEFAREDWSSERWNTFAKRLFYAAGDAAARGGLEQLQASLRKQEGQEGGRRLYYLAVAPHLYEEIARRLGEAKMNQEQGGFR